MCRVLGVHRSGYYAWLKAPESARTLEDRRIFREIERSYHETNGIYGSPRIHRDLRAVGIRCGRKRVARLMREHGLVAIRGYKKQRYKASQPVEAMPNLVAREFSVPAPNRVWVTDITYLRAVEGWLYLAAVMDLYSRKIVGWAVSQRMNTDLVLDALQQAIFRRKPQPGLIVHSDQGSQYGSFDWVNFLTDHAAELSMSRRGNCWDNAVKESFFSSLKREHIRNRRYESLREARQDLFSYIEMFYNPVRRHSFLDYISPIEFEKQQAS